MNYPINFNRDLTVAHARLLKQEIERDNIEAF